MSTARENPGAAGVPDRRESATETIRVRTCLLVPDHHGEEIPLTSDLATVGALLRYLGRRADFELVDGEGNIVRDIDVQLNQRDLNFCPAGLATPLRPDDLISIHLLPIGGG